MACECYTPIDHSCDAWQADNSIIPCDVAVVPSSSDDDQRSYFYIKMVAVFSTHNLEEEEDGDDLMNIDTLESVEQEKSFMVPYDQLIHSDASWSAISTMLSSVQVPIDIQPNMVHRISNCAQSMARAVYNKGCRVLPMIVSIYVEDYVDYNDEEEEDAVLRESMAVVRQKPASRASVEALETVRVEGPGFAKKCVICQEEILVGGEAKRMPCKHVYHGDCLVRWLSASNLCPLCRFEMPT